MSGTDVDPHLHVVADLQLDIDGLPVRVTGDGQVLEVYTADAADLVGAVLRTHPVGVGSPLRSLGFIGRQLDDAGLSVTVMSVRGPVATLGHGQRSALGRVIPAVRHLRPGAARVVVQTAASLLHRSPAWPRVRVAALIAISLSAIAAGARRNHH